MRVRFNGVGCPEKTAPPVSIQPSPKKRRAISLTCRALRSFVAARPLRPNSVCVRTWQSWQSARRLLLSYISRQRSAWPKAASTGCMWCTSVAGVILPSSAQRWQTGCRVSVSRRSRSQRVVWISLLYSLSFAIVIYASVVVSYWHVAVGCPLAVA